MYKLVFNNKEVELPKRTLEVEETLHNAKKIAIKYGVNEISAREFVEQLYSVIKFFFNDEQIIGFLGTDELMQIDIGDLDLLASEIASAYSYKINEYLKKKM